MYEWHRPESRRVVVAAPSKSPGPPSNGLPPPVPSELSAPLALLLAWVALAVVVIDEEGWLPLLLGASAVVDGAALSVAELVVLDSVL